MIFFTIQILLQNNKIVLIPLNTFSQLNKPILLCLTESSETWKKKVSQFGYMRVSNFTMVNKCLNQTKIMSTVCDLTPVMGRV